MTHECTACGLPILDDEWEWRHSPHDEGCPREMCHCDNEVHEYCCWECKRWWHGYSKIQDQDGSGIWEIEGTHVLAVLGESPVPPEQMPAEISFPAGSPLKYVGSWDHDPTEEEKDQMLPTEFREEA